jgi:hypothetical protein
VAKTIEQIAYTFRPRSCVLGYSFGAPLMESAFRYEQTYRLDIEGELIEPKLKNLKGASVRLYGENFDLSKGRNDEPSRPIGSLERSKGYFAAYIFVPVPTIWQAYQLVTAGGLDQMILFAPPMVRLRSPVTFLSFTAGTPIPE